MITNDHQVYQAALLVANTEEHLLALRKALCDGSMLRGHTAKELKDVNLEDVAQKLSLVEGEVQTLVRLVKTS